MEGSKHVLMQEGSVANPRKSNKHFNRMDYSPFLVCFLVTLGSLLAFYFIGALTIEADSSTLLQSTRMCDACDLNTDIEDYVMCRTCPFKSSEEKVLKCPSGKTDVKILSTRINGIKDAAAQAMIYEHCLETWKDDPDWDCTLNFAELMGTKTAESGTVAVGTETTVEGESVVASDSGVESEIVDDPYDPYTPEPEEKPIAVALETEVQQPAAAAVTPEKMPESVPEVHRHHYHPMHRRRPPPPPRKGQPFEYETVMEIEIDPHGAHKYDPHHDEFFEPMLDPMQIIEAILEPEGLPMGPFLSSTHRMYAALLFGGCADKKRPGCYVNGEKSKPTKCKGAEGDVIDMDRTSWPPCQDGYEPACEDGSELACSDGNVPQPPQLCTDAADVPVCRHDGPTATAEAECRKEGKIPENFLCGRFYPAHCPEGYTAMCSDGPATLPKKGGKGKGKGKGGKGKGKGNKGKGKGQGKGKASGSQQQQNNAPFLARYPPPPGKGFEPRHFHGRGMHGGHGMHGHFHDWEGFEPWNKFPDSDWGLKPTNPTGEPIIKVKYMCVSTSN